MTRQNSRMPRVIWFVVTTLMLAIVVLGMLFVVQGQLTPQSPATATNATLPASTSTADGYPGPTMQPTSTPTLEPDVSLTLAWLQTSQPIATVQYPTGIFEEGLGDYSKLGFNMLNGWRGQINGYTARVLAGALVSNPQQGIVLASWDLSGAPNAGVYDTPRQAGAVRITAEQNYRLTLQAEDGSIFYFDVAGQAFTASATVVVPTVTPRATYTPAMPLTAPVSTGYPIASATAVP